jgi:hypothetical protein
MFGNRRFEILSDGTPKMHWLHVFPDHPSKPDVSPNPTVHQMIQPTLSADHL